MELKDVCSGTKKLNDLGVNERGVTIHNTTLKVKKDEKEATLETCDVFYSYGGKIIRKALLQKSVDKAVKSLVDNEMEYFL